VFRNIEVNRMKARSFDTVQEMNDDQAARETEQALLVQSMSPEARMQWLEDHWGRLQECANLIWAALPQSPRAVRYFESFEEKNAYDDAREIERARQLQELMNR
jgi:hypothetical protein